MWQLYRAMGSRSILGLVNKTHITLCSNISQLTRRCYTLSHKRFSNPVGLSRNSGYKFPCGLHTITNKSCPTYSRVFVRKQHSSFNAEYDAETQKLMREITSDFDPSKHSDMNDDEQCDWPAVEAAADVENEDVSRTEQQHVSSESPEVDEYEVYLLEEEYGLHSAESAEEYEEYTTIEEGLAEHIDMRDEKPLPISLERGLSGVYDVSELVTLLESERGIDVVVIEVSPEKQYVDHMVIVSARSHRHLMAMAELVRWVFKRKRRAGDPLTCFIEGLNSRDWFAIDMGNIVLHLFLPDTRAKYDLETLWIHGPEYDEKVHGKTADDDVLEEGSDPFSAYFSDSFKAGDAAMSAGDAPAGHSLSQSAPEEIDLWHSPPEETLDISSDGRIMSRTRGDKMEAFTECSADIHTSPESNADSLTRPQSSAEQIHKVSVSEGINRELYNLSLQSTRVRRSASKKSLSKLGNDFNEKSS